MNAPRGGNFFKTVPRYLTKEIVLAQEYTCAT